MAIRQASSVPQSTQQVLAAHHGANISHTRVFRCLHVLVLLEGDAPGTIAVSAHDLGLIHNLTSDSERFNQCGTLTGSGQEQKGAPNVG